MLKSTLNVNDDVIIDGVNKISYIIHSIFPFWGLKMRAVDVYINEIEKSDLPAEVKFYSIANLKHNSKHFETLRDIRTIAINNARPGTDFSMNSNVSEEWLERYMDSAKYVTDSNIKMVWGKILSKEFEEPGCVSPNIVNILPSITSKYAELFGFICDMEIEILHEKNGEIIKQRRECVVPIQNDTEYFHEKGLSFFTLNELESLGLVKLHFSKDYIIKCNDEHLYCRYFNKTIICKPESSNEFPIGSVMLTETGKIIRDVIERRKQVGYYNELKTYYIRKGLFIKESYS